MNVTELSSLDDGMNGMNRGNVAVSVGDGNSIPQLPAAESTANENSNVIDMGALQQQRDADVNMKGHPPSSGVNIDRGPITTDSRVVSKDDIGKIMKGINRAAESGIMQIPNHEIEMNPMQYTTDSDIKPDHIPSSGSNTNYIEEVMTRERNTKKTNIKELTQTELIIQHVDAVAKTIFIPILLALLFYISETKRFRKYLISIIPSLFSIDAKHGGYDVRGRIVLSSGFGILVWGILKCAKWGEMLPV